MRLNGKYSVGILLTFVLLGIVMLYVFPVISMVTGTKTITGNTFLISRIAIWIVLLITFLYSLFIEKGSFLLTTEKSIPLHSIPRLLLFYIWLVSSGELF